MIRTARDAMRGGAAPLLGGWFAGLLGEATGEEVALGGGHDVDDGARHADTQGNAGQFV